MKRLRLAFRILLGLPIRVRVTTHTTIAVRDTSGQWVESER